MNIKKNLFKPFNRPTAMFLIVVGVCVALLPATVFALDANQSMFGKKTGAQDDQFDKKFREGRDLIDREEWAKAAVKFSDIVTYPKNKQTDAALYWLAFCHKKQKQYKQTDAALERLLKEFPASSWAGDARVMQMEIAAPLGKMLVSNAGTIYSAAQSDYKYQTELLGNLSAATTTAVELQPLEGFTPVQTSPTAARQPLDREDEIKIAAFQSLLAADAKRAIETMGEILSSDSKASETLKQEILRVLRSPRRSPVFVAANVYQTNANGIGKQFVPLLRETLFKSFQKESSVKIRKEIIYALAGIDDNESFDFLGQLYASENNQEIKKAIINSFTYSSQNSFAFATNAAPTKRIGLDKLMEILRTEKDTELRRLAFSNLQRGFGGWNGNEQTTELLSRFYDSETDEAIKLSIIRTFGAGKQNQAAKKLMDIAKNDKSDKLKLEAIFALRASSNNPEVLKFLEDLIK